MQIDGRHLDALILRGARAAYHLDGCPSWEGSFEEWLEAAKRVALFLDRHDLAEQLCVWRRRILEGEMTWRPAALPLDRDALKAALRPLCAIEVLDVLIPCPGEEEQVA